MISDKPPLFYMIYECPPTTIRIILRFNVKNLIICNGINLRQNFVLFVGSVANEISLYGTVFPVSFFILLIFFNLPPNPLTGEYEEDKK